MLTALKSTNLGLAFILELAMLIAFGYWGFHTGSNTLAKILLGIGIPLLVAILWGMFMAPRATRQLQGAAYLTVKVVLFGLATAALVVAGQPLAAMLLAGVFIVNTVLLEVWK